METFNIFLIGAGTGAVFSVISMLLINANNAEQYPVGGFLPALWIVAELGVDSKIVVAGILMMGGMTGYFLILTIWKRRPEALIKTQPQKTHVSGDSKLETEDEHSTVTVSGKSLAEFLKKRTNLRDNIVFRTKGESGDIFRTIFRHNKDIVFTVSSGSRQSLRKHHHWFY